MCELKSRFSFYYKKNLAVIFYSKLNSFYLVYFSEFRKLKNAGSFLL